MDRQYYTILGARAVGVKRRGSIRAPSFYILYFNFYIILYYPAIVLPLYYIILYYPIETLNSGALAAPSLKKLKPTKRTLKNT